MTHHDAAHGDQRSGTDAVFLSAHHRGHDDITPRAQTTIGAQGDPFAQIVHREHLVGLGQAHFPGQACIFDRCRGRRARPAIMARDQDHISLRLGHTGGNRTNPGGRHQLDRNLAARVDLLEVVDQLRQILDGIDIVVGRGGDQRHALGRVPQSRDQVGDLHAGKLTPFAGLCALGDLDFQLFAMVQILCGHPKPARGHLLDLGRRIVPIWLWHEMRRVFATLTRIRLRANPVHRYV